MNQHPYHRIDDLREIAIVIDTWDDIFSDFDPRPLIERTLSGDFVEELKKRYRETPRGSLDIVIYAPVSLKDEKSEAMVMKRLKSHFKYMFLQKKREVFLQHARGAAFLCVGVASLTFLTLATYYQFFSRLTINMLEVVFMPLGWFGIWEGFSKLVDTSKYVKDDGLYEKLFKARYEFKYVEA